MADTKPVWLEKAESQVGVHETCGAGCTEKIKEYHSCTSLKATSDEIPWCSAFVNWCMKQSGFTRTNSAAARSWLDYGKVLQEPKQGCIVILKRANNPQSGHVGFFASEVGNGFIKILGGNQSDQVKYSNFPASDVVGYRWPIS